MTILYMLVLSVGVGCASVCYRAANGNGYSSDAPTPKPPVVQFYTDRQLAAQAYQNSKALAWQQQRLFKIIKWHYADTPEIKELFVIPATSYEIIESTTDFKF